MWVRKSKRFLQSLGLSLLLFFVPCSLCSADVILTDSEAEELMSTIQESQKELTTVQTELSNVQTELNDVKNDYTEQKKSYEKQLDEAEREKEVLTKAVIATSASNVVLLSVLLLVLLL